MRKDYIGTYEEIGAIIAQVDSNANLPNDLGTQTWATPKETVTSGV
jgi:hypothetical protein